MCFKITLFAMTRTNRFSLENNFCLFQTEFWGKNGKRERNWKGYRRNKEYFWSKKERRESNSSDVRERKRLNSSVSFWTKVMPFSFRKGDMFSQGVTTHDIHCTKGIDIRLIFRRYPVYILDIRLLDSIETSLFSAIFQVYYLLTPVLWYPTYIQV